MSDWKMKDGTIRGYDALGNKRPEPSTFRWEWVCILALVGLLLWQVSQ